VGTNLAVLTNRLARIIDRSRVLEDRYGRATEEEQMRFEAELQLLYQRSHLIHRAITLSTSSALMVCLVVVTLFLGNALDVDLGKIIAGLFILAMFALIGSLMFFLREIFIATTTLSQRRPLLPLR
jgi:hypothetical protein